jgi:hypothetical protein
MWWVHPLPPPATRNAYFTETDHCQPLRGHPPPTWSNDDEATDEDTDAGDEGDNGDEEEEQDDNVPPPPQFINPPPLSRPQRQYNAHLIYRDGNRILIGNFDLTRLEAMALACGHKDPFVFTTSPLFAHIVVADLLAPGVLNKTRDNILTDHPAKSWCECISSVARVVQSALASIGVLSADISSLTVPKIARHFSTHLAAYLLVYVMVTHLLAVLSEVYSFFKALLR